MFISLHFISIFETLTVVFPVAGGPTRIAECPSPLIIQRRIIERRELTRKHYKSLFIITRNQKCTEIIYDDTWRLDRTLKSVHPIVVRRRVVE